jgi:hypothetical protein
MERYGALLQSQFPFAETHPALACVGGAAMVWGAIHQAILSVRFLIWAIQHFKRELTELWAVLLLLKREVTTWDPDKSESVSDATKTSILPPTPASPTS